MKEDPKWLEFEKLCASVKKEISKDSYHVEHSVKIMGRFSKTERQLDIVIFDKNDHNFFSFLDAKCYSKNVDVKDVESVIGMADDVNALKCGIVTTKGFSQAAYNLAKAKGVETVILADTNDHDWKLFLSIPFCVSLHTYQFPTGISLQGTIPLKLDDHDRPYSAELNLKGTGNTITLGDYFRRFIDESDDFGFDTPEGENISFHHEVPLDKDRLGDVRLSISGLYSKTIKHHVKRIVLDSYSGFVNPSSSEGEGNISLSFRIDQVETWPTVEEPPAINFCHPHLLSYSLP